MAASTVTKLLQLMLNLLRDANTRSHFVLLLSSIVYLSVMCYYCVISYSLALKAYSSLLFYDVTYFTIYLVMYNLYSSPAPEHYPFGYERIEVIAIFVSTMVNILLSLSIIKHAFEGIFETHTVTLSNHVFILVIVNIVYSCVFSHLLRSNCPHYEMLYSNQHNDVMFPKKLYRNVTFLASLLPGKISTLTVVNAACGVVLCLAYILIVMDQLLHADIVAAIIITCVSTSTFFPIAVYTGKILIQSLTDSDVHLIEKLLREASNFDGVNEIKEEYFWRVGFKSLCGTMDVHIREGFDSQDVLSQTYAHFVPHVYYLTIQIIKN